MSWYVGLYVSHCDLCLHTKAQHHLPVRELQPLLIPEECWNTVSVDFISELLESGRYNAIIVVVNSVGKQAHFSKMLTTVTAAGVANLYLWNIWKLHVADFQNFSQRVTICNKAPIGRAAVSRIVMN